MSENKQKYPGIQALNEATKDPLISRIMMDSIRAAEKGEPRKVKNPLRPGLRRKK